MRISIVDSFRPILDSLKNLLSALDEEAISYAGHNTVTWEAPANIVSGVYPYKLETAEFTSVKKMIFQK